MLATVLSSSVFGIEASLVEVEVDISNGLPAFNIVGLPDTACRESEDRVRAAIKNSGLSVPPKRITVNLAPADLKKEGASFDLAIAIGILTANEEIDSVALKNKIFCGELALDGKVRPIAGVLSRAVCLLNEKERKDLFVPTANLNEAASVGGLRVYPVKTLGQLIRFLRDEEDIVFNEGGRSATNAPQRQEYEFDFAEVKGQMHAKRALEIAAAGGHNILMIGPPGAGKTMLAKRIPSILSSLTFEESIETTKIHSVSGKLSRRSGLLQTRPFRDPHHTISDAALIGGGRYPKPGEVSLSHNGVLFLDEIAEFRRNVLEVLRQPLEEGHVTISRASSTVTLPSRFMLVAAMNPCPCGYFTDPKKPCHCTPVQIKNYMSKISGPLLDRIDIQLEVPCLKPEEITMKKAGEESSRIRDRVAKVREVQLKRYEKELIKVNADLGARQIERFCRMSEESDVLLKKAIQELGFSARAYHKSLKLARTIADMAGADIIQSEHCAEAIQYRALDRSIWMA